MNYKAARFFLLSASALLLVTAVAKFISINGRVGIFQIRDPIFAIPFRQMFCIVGSMELVVALVCCCGKRILLQASLVAWLATNILAYRFGLVWVDYHRPCGCMGNLTDALHISPQTADTATKIILAYLLLGSYATLFWLWRQKRKTPPLTPPAETVV